MLKTDLLESNEVVRQPGLALEHGRVGALKVERKLLLNREQEQNIKI